MARRTQENLKRRLAALMADCLSEEEIREIAASGVLLALDQSALQRLIARLGPETGKALRRLLQSLDVSSREAAPPMGRAKTRQEWEKAWAEWDQRIAESGEEHGKYVLQEHHWEAPYLDPSAVTHDLEPIAARMRKILPRVMDESLDPDFSFAAALQETLEEIGQGLPDWMEEDLNEGCSFGREVTSCLLEWEWKTAQRKEEGAFEFADKIRELEDSEEGMGLDDDTLAAFFLKLSEGDKKAIRKGIAKHRSTPHWKSALESKYSCWFRLYQKLSRRSKENRRR